MVQRQYRHEYPNGWGPGPSHNQNQILGFSEAENPSPNHIIHEASVAIPEDGYTGLDPGHAWVEANDNAGGGEVQRTPSKNPLMADHNLT
jgi:hypothetical protein